MSNGEGWERSRRDYGQQALASLAAVQDALDLAAAADADRGLRLAKPPSPETPTTVATRG